MMSTAQLFVAPAATVNCHCTPVSLFLSTAMAGLPPLGAPVPVNGIMTVGLPVGTVSAACGAYEVESPAPFGSDALFECALSLVEYWALQPVPAIVPVRSNLMPVNAVASMQSVPAALPLK